MKSSLKLVKLLALYLVIFNILTFNIFAFASTRLVNYQTNDFSISFPDNFNFTKKEILSKAKNTYLFADHEKLNTANNKPSRFHEGIDISDNEPNVLVYVEPLPNIPPKELDFTNHNVIVNSECTYIAFLNADTKNALNFSVAQKDFVFVHQNCEGISVNGNKFQKYKLTLPKIVVTYFASISHKKMFVIEMISRSDKKTFLTEKSMLDILKTFKSQ